MLVSLTLDGADCPTLFYYKPVFLFPLIYPFHLMAYGHGVVIYTFFWTKEQHETNIWSELAMILAGALGGAWHGVMRS
jgi:hypothetical protein